MFGWVMAILTSTVTGLLFCFKGPMWILPVGFLIFLISPKVREFYVRDYYT